MEFEEGCETKLENNRPITPTSPRYHVPIPFDPNDSNCKSTKQAGFVRQEGTKRDNEYTAHDKKGNMRFYFARNYDKRSKTCSGISNRIIKKLVIYKNYEECSEFNYYYLLSF